MMHKFLFVHLTLLLVLLGLAGPVLAQRPGSPAIVSETEALKHGLARAWMTQVELDRTTDHLTYVTQENGQLLVQTRLAMVHVLDAETGRTVWAQQIGQRSRLSLPPGANDKFVAIINGTMLYVVNRADGRREWEQHVDGAPGSGPALNDKYVYVPMVNGLVQGFQIEKPRLTPWVYRSLGRVLVQPIITPHTLSWTTNKGYFYVVDTAQNAVRFRLETRGSIESQPAYWPPYLYACSMDGYVYCVNEQTSKDKQASQVVWKYPVGEPFAEPPVAINGNVYVVPRNEMMYCLDGATGELKWSASGATQFISASAARVYACDRFGRLLILDGKHGTRLGTMPLPGGSKKLVNHQTDRLYLTTDTGLVQCLHEVQLKKPLIYEPPKELTPELRQKQVEKKQAEEAATQPEATKPEEKPVKPAKPETEEPAADDSFGSQ